MTTPPEVQTQGPIARYEQSVIDRIADFKDPRQEWRRLFAEVLGTFFLVLVAAGGGMIWATRSQTRSPAPTRSSHRR